MMKRLLLATGAAQKRRTHDLQSYQSERHELRCSHLSTHNQQYEVEPHTITTKPSSSYNYWLFKNATSITRNKGEMLPSEAHRNVNAAIYFSPIINCSPPVSDVQGWGLGADVYVCVCGGGGGVGLGQAKNRIKTNRTNIIATNFV